MECATSCFYATSRRVGRICYFGWLSGRQALRGLYSELSNASTTAKPWSSWTGHQHVRFYAACKSFTCGPVYKTTSSSSSSEETCDTLTGRSSYFWTPWKIQTRWKLDTEHDKGIWFRTCSTVSTKCYKPADTTTSICDAWAAKDNSLFFQFLNSSRKWKRNLWF